MNLSLYEKGRKNLWNQNDTTWKSQDGLIWNHRHIGRIPTYFGPIPDHPVSHGWSSRPYQSGRSWSQTGPICPSQGVHLFFGSSPFTIFPSRDRYMWNVRLLIQIAHFRLLTWPSKDVYLFHLFFLDTIWYVIALIIF